MHTKHIFWFTAIRSMTKNTKDEVEISKEQRTKHNISKPQLFDLNYDPILVFIKAFRELKQNPPIGS